MLEESILVISFKLLGDIIVQTPAIKSLKNAYPNSKLRILVDERFKDVLVGNIYIDEILSYPISKYKNSNFLKKIILMIPFLLKLRKYRFKKVLLMDKTSFGCLSAFFSGAKRRIGLKNQGLSFLLNTKINYKEGSMDYIDFYNLIAKEVFEPSAIQSSPLQDRKTQLFIDPIALLQAKNIIENFFHKTILNKNRIISIHLGASRDDKRWCNKQCALFIGKILKESPTVALVVMCGPKENHLIEELFSFIDSNSKHQILNAGALYIKELCAFFSISQLVICYDSASRHVAAALGKFTLVLMNHWNLENWMLYSENEGQFTISPQNEIENQYDIKNISYELVFKKYMQIISNYTFSI